MPDPKNPINLDDIDFGHTLRGHQKGDRVFDRFVLEKLLGRGGMGVVWLAKDERLGREVALKFAPEAVRFDEVAVDELKEETRKGLDLAHPNIVKIYDFLMDEEHAAISMEFIDGENLGALRTRQPNKVFEPTQISHWVGQLLDALDYAHRGAKVIHRDLKPANLMIDREGNLRVTDFGIARSISDAMTRATLGSGNSTGTLAYMSPQQADGKKPHVSDDLYALGSTLYELLTGKPPFFSGNIAARLHDETAASLSERRREFGINRTEPIPAEWEHTILSLLEKAPENRPASAQTVRHRLGIDNDPMPDVPPVPTLPGQPGFHGGPQTSFTRPQTQLRSGGGLTEVNLPGRATALGGMTAAPPTVGPPLPGTYAPPPPSGGGSAGLWIAVIGGLLGLVMMAGAGWWIYTHTAFFRQKPVDGPTIVHQPTTPNSPTDSTDPVNKIDPGKTLVPTIPTPTVPTHPAPPTPPTLPKVSAIQALINEAKPGSEVIVPEGNYEEQIQFKEGIKLKAAPGARVIVQTDGRVGSVLQAANCKSGSISGITFQHTGSEVVQSVSWPVVLIKSSSITLEGCTMQSGVSDGLVVSGVGNSQILRCTVRNNAKNGIVFESGVTATLTATECRQNGECGVEARHSGTSPVLQSCALVDNGNAGIAVKDGASMRVLEKTRCQDNKDAGISAAGEGVFLTVVDAICEGNLVGIALQEFARGSIRDTTINGSHQAGVQLGMTADGTELVNNTVTKSTMEGMLVTGANGKIVTITGNKVSRNGGSGIGVYGAGFRPLVENNECLTNANYGILATEGVSGIIRDNTVRDNNSGPIGNENAAPDIVIQGNITDKK